MRPGRASEFELEGKPGADIEPGVGPLLVRGVSTVGVEASLASCEGSFGGVTVVSRSFGGCFVVENGRKEACENMMTELLDLV